MSETSNEEVLPILPLVTRVAHAFSVLTNEEESLSKIVAKYPAGDPKIASQEGIVAEARAEYEAASEALRDELKAAGGAVSLGRSSGSALDATVITTSRE